LFSFRSWTIGWLTIQFFAYFCIKSHIVNSRVESVKGYCNSLVKYSRRETVEVKIGDLPMGGSNPIRIQSMTTVDTMDTMGSVDQTIRMIDAGCEYVRITAPSVKEAQNLAEIKKELRKRGYSVPLIADIHFTPNAAELAARIVEKVRINPGNYADKKRFETIDYTEASYQAELDRIRQKFLPLIRICKEYGTAMRIGTNHGSLSDRIMSRYGDNPVGMVESALEFLRICEDESFYNIVLSMKSSNPQVMVQAYRLLVQKMDEEGFKPYPLHLGVTEAGDGEDGRIKSSVGIGTLLEDGLGDTVRVSLTEEPEAEVPVAFALARRYDNRSQHEFIPEIRNYPITPFEYNRRRTRHVLNIGGDHNVPRVIADFSDKANITPASLFGVGYNYSKQLDKWNISDAACDFIFAGDTKIGFDIPGTLGVILHFKTWLKERTNPRTYPYLSAEEYLSAETLSAEVNFVYASIHNVNETLISRLSTDKTSVLVLDTKNLHGMAEQRAVFATLMSYQCDVPVIIARSYGDLSFDDFQLYSATDMGGLLVDGLGDGILLSAPALPDRDINLTGFNILQATRTRISKTEYISCPSCGRTLFDLQETTAKIRSRTSHLKGVKIGIMGCIVNGPGEMADADYGYVGSGPGRITLYKGKEVVRRNVPTPQAVDELVNLIRENGDWIEPVSIDSSK
jgi:(E)-4-hydroxy-3-methylbut-2-enyl-diphosphate synthase